MIGTQRIDQLETHLNSFSSAERASALSELYEQWQSGSIAARSETEALNVHAHSFYSYNAYGFSPSALAWLAKKHGLSLMGIVDFDTLDGVDEFLDACETLGVRGIAGIETRVYIPEFKDSEINSPGEPGVAYHMGTGFVSSEAPKSAIPGLVEIRKSAEARNRAILERVNQFLAPLKLDYDDDILPLTPAGYATERHMVQKIAEKAAQIFKDPMQFWEEKLDQPRDSLIAIMDKPVAFQNLLRKRLMKRGGVAYVQPDAGTFPSVDAFHAILEASEAIPCSAWLDGTSQGEQDIEKLLDLLIAKGVSALNIVPDRNWNIQDPELKERKLKELYRIVDLADDLDLPILVGTEMNSPGQKVVDDFDAPELAPVKDSFIRGAFTIYGHTRMQRLWGMGRHSHWSSQRFTSREANNGFYESVGRILPADWKQENVREWINPNLTPEETFNIIRQKIKDTK
jgi:hypothetical protein